jgi:phosphodiesterase/alkaline phosphatase D-like protein
VTLNGNLTSPGTATAVRVGFEYGLTGKYGNFTDTKLVNGVGTFSINVVGLNPGTLYHVRALADGGIYGDSTGGDLTFTTLTAPVVHTGTAENITLNSVTLNGNLAFMGTSSSVDVAFEYGTTEDYETVIPVRTMSAAGTFSITLTGLAPNTIYHFEALGDGGINGVASGEDVIFTTNKIPPVVSTQAATGITNSQAVLNGNLVYRGTAPLVNLTFEYGTTTGYGSFTPSQNVTSTGKISAKLTGLNPSTLYHFRIIANAGAHGSDTGDDMTFTTLTLPLIVDPVLDITDRSSGI